MHPSYCNHRLVCNHLAKTNPLFSVMETNSYLCPNVEVLPNENGFCTSKKRRWLSPTQRMIRIDARSWQHSILKGLFAPQWVEVWIVKTFNKSFSKIFPNYADRIGVFWLTIAWTSKVGEGETSPLPHPRPKKWDSTWGFCICRYYLAEPIRRLVNEAHFY